ncbi:heavy metal-binding domain-containing protein [Burkholderia pyrrocinia]|uniref:heavy metal-binding domain-containing protein n=1 Tax=Burkholderia pyrrocinia TaxID=60550 RepID=UPI001BCA94C5|nr:heavy metal-binding domain-containing protein [Burkholderia pyrrocinia]QVN23430.1 heavy metal-binding domain-containing protein [Burkholderia pyrrocinia]
MGWLSSLFKSKNGPNTPSGPVPEFFDARGVPNMVHQRLADSKSGTLPWVSTLTAPEMALARSHGLKMIAPIAATCWMHYGFSWTEGHAQGWRTALKRLEAEAIALGANAVIDVRMVTVDLYLEDSMDYSLVGTAVRIEGLPPSPAPIISTVPALEFIQLLEARIIPVGLAIGARFEWSKGPLDIGLGWRGNQALPQSTAFWERIRRRAHADLRADAARQGSGVLAQLQFSQLIRSGGENDDSQLLGRHIVMGTVVDCPRGVAVPHNVEFVLDLSDKPDNLRATSEHHNAYSDGI